ncbi:MAG TPA: formate dehydrogenase subunit delta [Steroidobacteraceae bacterium]|jgi:formate dehydrogenase subunit delta
MGIDRLVTMANEIAAFFEGASDSEKEAAENVAAHLRRFWAPQMRKKIVEHVSEGGEGLAPVARAAIELLAADIEHA